MSFGVFLTRMPFLELKNNAKKHIVEIQKDHDLWKDRCARMVRRIGPVLDLLDPGLSPTEPRAQ
jgi:hypothetical protein